MKIFLKLLVGLSTLTTFTKLSGEEVPSVISMVSLISTPERFTDKNVRLYGVLRVEDEASALYLSRFDFENRISVNAIWLSITENEGRAYAGLSGRVVLLEGKFDPLDRGHFNMYSGSLRGVSNVTIVK